nr:hypothetical protein [Starkeya nomas]
MGGDDEGTLARWRGIDDGPQLRPHRNLDPHRPAPTVLFLNEREEAFDHMLRPQRVDIAPAPARVQKQRERQARRRADRMRLFELAYLVDGPCVEAFARGVDLPDAHRRIRRDQLLQDAPGEEGLEVLHQLVGRAWLIAPLVSALFDVLAPERRQRQRTGNRRIAVEHTALVILRRQLIAAKQGRGVVACQCVLEAALCDALELRACRFFDAADGAVVLRHKWLGCRTVVIEAGLHPIFLSTRHPNVPPIIPTAIRVLHQVAQLHRSHQSTMSSRGLWVRTPSRSASQCSRICSVSHSINPSTLRPLGIRPSATHLSKVDGDTLRLAAASSRLSAKRGKVCSLSDRAVTP